MQIGCIGQGFIGKNIANDFEHRGYSVVRYALEPQYVHNKELITSCDIVFVAVPTPTTPEGFDYSIVEDVIKLTGAGSIVVIKSTILPGTTKILQNKYTDRVVLFSPEFLCEKTAAYDAAHPIFNIIGISKDTDDHRKAAVEVEKLLPECEHNFVTTAETAELFKYIHNINGYMRVVLANLMYDVGAKLSVNWDDAKEMMDVDPMMSPFYNLPIHKGGRGAGGNCFVKDMAAFRRFFTELLPDDKAGVGVFEAMEIKNLNLLKESEKSEDIVRSVYGDKM